MRSLEDLKMQFNHPAGKKRLADLGKALKNKYE